MASAQSIHDRVVFKQEGLDRLLQYDAYLRKSLIDHFYEPHVTLNDLAACQENELGDFVTGHYEHRLHRGHDDDLLLILQRTGRQTEQQYASRKISACVATATMLEVHYLLENLPRDQKLHFAVEWNFAGMAAGADDRYFYYDDKPKAGQLQTLQDWAKGQSHWSCR